jgi:hypothetical protein
MEVHLRKVLDKR